MIDIIPASTDVQLATVRELFLEYADTLGFDLDFQNFDRDINELPGVYGPPEGRLFLATCDGEVAGCVGMKKLAEGVSEMKRLWVKPRFRGKKIGRMLVERLLEEARAAGYARMRLDTIETMTEAMVLYKSLGFEKIEAYYDNPVEGATYFEKNLTVGN